VIDALTAAETFSDLYATMTLDSTTSTAGTNLYYMLTSTEPTYTPVTKLYVAYYSAADCPTADFVNEDQFTIKTSGITTTTALTSDSSLYGEITFDFPTLTVYDRCPAAT